MLTQSSPRTKDYGSVPTSSHSAAALTAPIRTTPGEASLFSRLLFNYANPLMELGNERQLNKKDLWVLEGENQCAVAFAGYHAEYKRTNGSVLRAMWNCYWKTFVLYAVTMILTVAVALFAPAVLNHVINAFATPEIDVQDLVTWLSLFFASRILNAVVFTQMSFYLQLVALRVTVSLKSLLFQKVMRRSIQSKSNDEKAVDIANLYTSDVINILWAAFVVNNVWILPL